MTSKQPQNLAKVFGENLVKRRLALGMTQADLAEKMGMAPDALSRIENGYIAPRFGRIEAMANTLGCSVAELFRITDSTTQTNSAHLADIIRPLDSTQQQNIIDLVAHVVMILHKQ